MIFKQSSKAILSNKGRSFLTILGIIIGIGSVIALISLGNGVQASITGQISKLGSTNLTVSTGFGGAPGTGVASGRQNARSSGISGATSSLTVDDLNALSDGSHPSISKATGTISGSTILAINGTEERKTVSGVSVDYFSIYNLKSDKGSIFDTNDISKKNKVVGRLETATESIFNNPNSLLLIPYTAAQGTFSSVNFSSLTVQASSDNKVDQAKSDIEDVLLKRSSFYSTSDYDFINFLTCWNCCDIPCSRRNRNYEYYASFCYRANSRNRFEKSSWSNYYSCVNTIYD